jgi:hypothetical protein
MFKSKAINAQGSRIYVDDGAGTAIADITAISKAAQAVVSSVGAGRAVGEVVRFGAVANMPEIAGMAGIITAVVPATSFTVDIDTSGFALAGGAGVATELAFVSGCEVKTFNGFDGQSAELDITTLCSEAREYLIGLQDFGTFSFDVNLVPNDPFQVEMMEAKRLRTLRAFRLVLPPGQDAAQYEYLFDGFVRQFSISGGVDTPLAGAVALRVTGEPSLVEIV